MGLDHRRILHGPDIATGRRRPAARSSAMLIAMALILLILLAAFPLLMNDRVADSLGTALRYGVGDSR